MHVPGPWSLFACCADTHQHAAEKHCKGVCESELEGSASKQYTPTACDQATGHLIGVRGDKDQHGNQFTVESQCDTQSAGMIKAVGSLHRPGHKSRSQ